MKKTIALTLITGLALGTTALAQGMGHGGHHHFGQIFDRLDTNGDGKITQDELKAAVQKRFAEFDLNKDGKVSEDEAKQVAESKLGERREKRAEWLKEADKNGDGKWSKDELPRMPERFFAKLDTNKDGVLTRDEFAAGRARFDEHKGEFFERFFERADANKDGVIDANEALQVAQKRFERADTNKDGVVERDEAKAMRMHHRPWGEHASHRGQGAQTGQPSSDKT